MTKLIHLTTVDMSLELLLGHQLRAARQAGYEVVGVSAPGPWITDLSASGVRHVALEGSTRGWDVFADLRAARNFCRILRQERPDIVHTHNPKPGLYGRVLARWAGVPIVVNTVHGLYATSSDPTLKRAVVYCLEAIAARFSDHELVQSSEDLALMRRMHLVPAGRLTHLGNGVDLKYFDPELVNAESRNRLRAELGLASDTLVVGAVGRLVAEKGWRELFRALDKLGRTVAFTALAIGPEDHSKPDSLTTEELAAAAAAGVRLLGLRRDMRELYSLMDLFVLPSHREGFPRALMEATAMGVPVVATDIRGCREAVVPGTNGVLVPPGDADALAEAMADLLSDQVRRAHLSTEGRLLALERFDAQRVSNTVLTLYQQLADRKGLTLFPHPALIRPAHHRDARDLAELHLRAIATGFLSSLGVGPLVEIYRGLIGDPDSVVLTVRDRDRRLLGFIAGSRRTSRTYRRLLTRRGPALALRVVPEVLRRPSVVARVVESLRYPAQVAAHTPAAELLAMAVTADWRSKGLGRQLVSEFVDRLGAPAVRVAVGGQNLEALRFYRAQGFEPEMQFEVHSGQTSELLVWRSSSH